MGPWVVRGIITATQLLWVILLMRFKLPFPVTWTRPRINSLRISSCSELLLTRRVAVILSCSRSSCIVVLSAVIMCGWPARSTHYLPITCTSMRSILMAQLLNDATPHGHKQTLRLISKLHNNVLYNQVSEYVFHASYFGSYNICLWCLMLHYILEQNLWDKLKAHYNYYRRSCKFWNWVFVK